MRAFALSLIVPAGCTASSAGDDSPLAGDGSTAPPIK
jgi:hypothetical protein